MDTTYTPTTTTSVDPGTAMAMFAGFWVIWLAFMVFYIVVMWRIYTRAGKPGWAAIVPIYNVIVLLEIVGRPVWWILLLFVPLVNFVIGIIVAVDLAKAFGRDVLFAVLGLILFSPIGYAILAFSGNQYLGVGGGQGAQPASGPGNPPAGPTPPAAGSGTPSAPAGPAA